MAQGTTRAQHLPKHGRSLQRLAAGGRGSLGIARSGPSSLAQLQMTQRLQHRPQVQGQLQLAQTLNQRSALQDFTQRETGLSSAAPQASLASVAASPAADAGVVQRTVAKDLADMGLASGYEAVIGNSTKAQQLIAKADELGVQIRWGGSHAQTVRTQGGDILRVTIPQTDSKTQALEDIVFELNNAVRYDRMQALSQKAVSGEIADEDEFAREKIKIELEGMLTTGRIGFELKKSGQDIPLDRFFLPTFLDSLKAYKEDPDLTRADFIRSKADEVLDRPHHSGSHRKVYTQQFRDLANDKNLQARERNEHLKGRAGQILTFAKFTDLDDAVKKFFLQTSEGPDVARWVASQSEATRWQPLHAAFKNYFMRRKVDALNNENDLETAIGSLSKSQAATLFAWIERHDEGKYRNLSQLLGLYLGYYDNKPELLRTNIYA